MSLQDAKKNADSVHPVTRAIAVTKSDTTTFVPGYRALWVGVGGNVAVTFLDDSTAIFVGVGNGTLLPVQVKQVLSTGTTASSILGLY